MAKKEKAKKRTKTEKAELREKLLPQNIFAMGEKVEENKNIYILQKVYKDIHKFTKNKTTNESGGMLVGYTIEEFGKTNMVIEGFIEAKYCEATPTTLKFTHETWEYVHKEIDNRFPGAKILGWTHTHPDFGIFLSEYDRFIHENFFSEDYQIAHVIDPIQGIEGFYFRIDGKLERCPGFYVYDKTGSKINLSKLLLPEDDDNEAGGRRRKNSGFSFGTFWSILLTCAVVVLFFLNLSLEKEVKELRKTVQEHDEIFQQMAAISASYYGYNYNNPMYQSHSEPEQPEKEINMFKEPEQTAPKNTEGQTKGVAGNE